MFVGVFLSLVSVYVRVQKVCQALSLESKVEIHLLFRESLPSSSFFCGRTRAVLQSGSSYLSCQVIPLTFCLSRIHSLAVLLEEQQKDLKMPLSFCIITAIYNNLMFSLKIETIKLMNWFQILFSVGLQLHGLFNTNDG